MADTTPQGVTIAHHPCVTGSCADCSEKYGDPDFGSQWHFDSVQELLKDVARYAVDDEEGLWSVVDGALLCRQCAADRQCAARGHVWRHYSEHVWHDHEGKPRTSPEHWRCVRSCSAIGVVEKPDGTIIEQSEDFDG